MILNVHVKLKGQGARLVYGACMQEDRHSACVELIGEAKILAEFLELRGFDVACVNCKVGGIEKTEMGLKKYLRVRMLSYEHRARSLPWCPLRLGADDGRG